MRRETDIGVGVAEIKGTENKEMQGEGRELSTNRQSSKCQTSQLSCFLLLNSMFALFGDFCLDILGFFGLLQYLLLTNIRHTFTNEIFLRDKDHCNFCAENVMT